MAECPHCFKNVSDIDVCPDCGTSLWTLNNAKIYCGKTTKDDSYTILTVTDKYVVLKRISAGELNARAFSGLFGVLGVLTVAAATSKERSSGFIAYEDVEKAIYPFIAKGVKKNSSVKLIMKDGTDVVLEIGHKKTRNALLEQISEVEYGGNEKPSEIICENPYTNLHGFDKLPRKGIDDVPEKKKTRKKKSAEKKETESDGTEVAEPATEAPAEPVPEVKIPEAKPVEGNTGKIPLKCEKCGELVPEDSKFCNHCGETVKIPISGLKVCENCGETLEADDVFCNKCGAKVTVPEVKKVCRECGEELEVEDMFCNKCGARVSDIKKCSGCGRELEPDDVFCNTCGTKI